MPPSMAKIAITNRGEIMGKIVSILIFTSYLSVAHNIADDMSCKKARFYIYSGFVLSFVAAYLVITADWEMSVVKVLLAIIGIVFMGGYLLGHIVGLFSIDAMEKIASVWAGLRVFLFFVIPVGVAWMILVPWFE